MSSKVLVALVFLMAVGTSAQAETRVNVLFRPGTSAAEKDRALIQSGASKLKNLDAHNIVTATVASTRSLHGLETDANVAAVGADLRVVIVTNDAPSAQGGKPGGTGSSPSQVVPAGVRRIGAWPASGNTGVGVKVAIVDTGIDLTHPDLAANIVGSYNAINSRKSANDDNGHGTHVSGTVAALNNTTGVVGVAPQAKLLAIKVLSASGSGYLSDVAEGIDASVARGAQVIGMSLGYAAAPNPDPVAASVTAAATSGVVIVCAAGNDGPASNTVNYPAKYPECIAVSAWYDVDGTAADVDGSGPDETLASFSSRGPEVELTAPGVNILSTWRGGGTKVLSGTSMATPHVSGAVARLISAGSTDPRADLHATAVPVSGTSDEVGSGLVQAAP